QLAAHQCPHLRPRRHAGQHHRQRIRRSGRHPTGRAHRHGRRAARVDGRCGHPRPRLRQPLRPEVGSGRMSVVMTPPPDAPSLSASPRSRRRKVSNLLASLLISLTFVIAVVPLVFLVIYVVQKGSKVMSWSFLTDDLPFVDRLPGGGMGPAVVGTLLITGAASLMAIPIGILGGIYLNEYGGRSPPAPLLPFPSQGVTGRPPVVLGPFLH